MAVLQLYWTVWNNAEQGFNGEQVKAASPHLTDDMIKQARDKTRGLFFYETPVGVDALDIDAHPVALRYGRIAPDTCVFLRCRYTGPDQSMEHTHGGYSDIRYGNRFIHALFLSPRDFAVAAPVLYWESPFWKPSDPEPGMHDLPELKSFQEQPSLSRSEVWDFIKREDRRDLLYPLLCAVLAADADRNPRPIVIVDRAPHVAHWIAAVTLLLPPAHRMLLTFTTYSPHFPSPTHPSPFTITGIFPGTPIDVRRDFMDFFILDASRRTTGAVEDSRYARWAVDKALADRYDSEVSPILQAAALRPAPHHLGDYLDGLLVYSDAVNPKRQNPWSELEVQSMHELTDALSRAAPLQADRLDALIQLHSSYLRGLRLAWLRADVQDAEDYWRTVESLQQHDRNAPVHLQPDVETALEVLLATRRADEGVRMLGKLRHICGDDMLSQAIQPKLLHQFLAPSHPDTPQRVLLIWQNVGELLAPSSGWQNLLELSLRLAYPEESAQSDATRARLSSALGRVCRGQALGWLQVAVQAVQSRGSLPCATLNEFYYALVREVRDPAARREYRSVVEKVCRDVADFEFRRDLASADPAAVVATLERWSAGPPQSQSLVRRTLPDILRDARARLTPTEWRSTACLLLLAPHLSPFLSQEMQTQLVQDVVANSSLQQISPDEQAVYRKYHQYPGLPDELTARMRALLALSTGQLDGQAATWLHRLVVQLDEHDYALVCEQLMQRCFADVAEAETHGNVVMACYVPHRAEAFWRLYWDHLEPTFAMPTRSEFLVDLLTFWFRQAPDILGGVPYIVPEFFLKLPGEITRVKKQRGFRETWARVVMLAGDTGWFTRLEPLLHDDQGLFGRVLRRS